MPTRGFFSEAQNLIEDWFKMFSPALDEGYNPVRTYLNRGVAFLNREDYDKAIKDFSAVVQLDSANESGYYYRGIAEMYKRDFGPALEDLTHAIDLNPKRSTAFQARGLIESELGRHAVSDFRMAIASDVESSSFAHSFGNMRTLFDESIALPEEDCGPLRYNNLTETEIKKLETFMEH